jgi:hypothetical protein
MPCTLVGAVLTSAVMVCFPVSFSMLVILTPLHSPCPALLIPFYTITLYPAGCAGT